MQTEEAPSSIARVCVSSPCPVPPVHLPPLLPSLLVSRGQVVLLATSLPPPSLFLSRLLILPNYEQRRVRARARARSYQRYYMEHGAVYEGLPPQSLKLFFIFDVDRG